MSHAKPWAYLLVIITTVLITIAQFLLKSGVNTGTYYNGMILAGLALYAIGSGTLILAFKGGDVSVLYPFIATSYIWVALISQFYLLENVHALRWVGIFIIIAGVLLINTSGRTVAV